MRKKKRINKTFNLHMKKDWVILELQLRQKEECIRVDLVCYSCSYMNRLFTAGAGLAACIRLHAYCKPAQAVNKLFMQLHEQHAKQTFIYDILILQQTYKCVYNYVFFTCHFVISKFLIKIVTLKIGVQPLIVGSNQALRCPTHMNLNYNGPIFLAIIVLQFFYPLI